MSIKIKSSNYKSIITKIDASSDAEVNFDQLRDLCIYLVRHDQKNAQIQLKRALKIAANSKDDLKQASILMQFGNLHLIDNKLNAAKNYYNQTIPLIANDNLGLGSIYNNLAIIEYYLHNQEECYKNYQISYDYRKNDDWGIAKATKRNLALAYTTFGEFDKAVGVYLEMLNNLNENNPVDFEELSSNFSGLAICYGKMGELDKAMSYINKNIQYITQVDNPKNTAKAYYNKAHLLTKLNQHSNAEEYAKKSKLIYTQIGNEGGLAEIENLLGEIFIIRKEFTQAINHINNAIKIHEQGEKVTQLVHMYFKKAEAYFELEDYAKAISSANESLNFIKDKNENDHAALIYGFLYKVYKLQGNYQKALKNIEHEKRILENIFNADKNKAIAEMEAKYETAQKEQKAQQLELEKLSFQQKALRAQMNPHFIFNSLNSIQSYISLNETKVASIYLASFSKLMRQILENSNDEFVPLEKVIKFLTEYLRLEQMRFKHSFTYNVIIDDEVEEDIMQIPSMIIQPYIENAILHGINDTEEGRIEIEFKMENDNTILCVVDDNGVGVNEAKKNKAEKQHKSMGTQITADRIKALTSKHKGKLKTKTIDKSKMGLQGTQVKIFLPIFITHNGNP